MTRLCFLRPSVDAKIVFFPPSVAGFFLYNNSYDKIVRLCYNSLICRNQFCVREKIMNRRIGIFFTFCILFPFFFACKGETDEFSSASYTITYEANDDSGAVFYQTVPAKESTQTLSAKEIGFYRSGYEFSEWNTNPDGTGRKVGRGGFITVYADTTLYAFWSESYTITYHLNGGTNSQKNRTRASYTEKDLPFTFGEATKKGYVFDGWYVDSDFSQKITEIEKGSAVNVEIYAKWKEVSSVQAELYVSENGDDSNDGLSEENAVKTISQAISLIKSEETDRSNTDWKIYLVGSVTGATTVEIGSENANSLTFEGLRNTEASSDQDYLIGTGTEAAITLKNSVPVTFYKVCVTGGKGGIIAEGTGDVIIKNAAIMANTDSGIKITGSGNVSITAALIGGTDSTNGNSAEKGAGIYMAGTGTLSITDSTIAYNKASAHGGGIALENAANLTLSDGVNIKENEATQNGGGIWNSGSTLTIDGAEISGNKALQHGGGIYNAGTLKIESGSVNYNYASASGDNYSGGGIYNNGIVTMTGGSVSYNSAASRGGGVAHGDDGENATFTMGGGSMNGNKSETSGGAVCLFKGSFFMYGDAIIGSPDQNTVATASSYANYAGVAGGGMWVGTDGKLYLGYKDASTESELSGGFYRNYAATTNTGGGGISNGGTLKMASGTISNNATAHLGGGIYMQGKMMAMKGSASIPANNDVWVRATKPEEKEDIITISGTLSATTPVATITPASYTEGKQVLAEITSGLLALYYDKFAVTPESSQDWGIDSEGKLQKQTAYTGTTSQIEITDSSQEYVINGNGVNNGQIDIRQNAGVTSDSTYYITLNNVKRTAGQWESAFMLYNNAEGTTLTVYITLIGENVLNSGSNHGGIQLQGASGATINVIFRTSSSGTLSFDSTYSGSTQKDLSVNTVTANFSIEDGSKFSNATSGGTSYTDASSFFEAAKNSTSGSSFTLTKQ